MKEYVLSRRQVLEVGIDQAFEFFSKAENLEAITPEWPSFRITTQTPIEMEVGTMIRYRLALHGIPVSWLTRIDEWNPPHSFVDRQLEGPYALWHHTHTFESLGPERTEMGDRVRYGQRLGPLGAAAEHLIVRRDLNRIFDHRAERIANMVVNQNRS